MNRRGRSNLGVFLLLAQILNMGVDTIPKVTLVSVVGQILIFLRVFRVPSINQVCASVLSVWYREDYRRLLFATYFHADDWHLYYNMVSFLWKGRQLEPRLGPVYFAVLIALFGVLTNGLMLLINSALEVFLHKAEYLTHCAVGFSGVLFALKVILTHQSRDQAAVLGFIPIPMRYAVWAELVVIQLISPNASFVGHLAGIIVGLAYCKGPLKSLLDPFFLTAPPRFHSNTNYNSSSSSSSSPSSNPYSAYTGGLSEDEQLRAAMQASLGPQGAHSPNREELRRRRLARYDS